MDSTLYALKRARNLSKRYSLTDAATVNGWTMTDAGIYNTNSCLMYTWQVVGLRWTEYRPGGAYEMLKEDATGNLYEFLDTEGNRKIIYSALTDPTCRPRLNLEKHDSTENYWYNMYDSDPYITHIVQADHYVYYFTGKLGRYLSKDWMVTETIATNHAMYSAVCIDEPSIEFRRHFNILDGTDTGWKQTYATWH